MKINHSILIPLFGGIILGSCHLGLTKSESLKEWIIEEYKIVYSRKIGPAGPHYFQYDIYKNEKHLSYVTYLLDKDSCLLRFREKNDYYIDFNLCVKTKRVHQPDKKQIKLSTIDSIKIRPYNSIRLVPRKSETAPFYDSLVVEDFDSTFMKRLNRNQIEALVNKWNKSEPHGLKNIGTNYHYLLTIYSKGYSRRIKTLNRYMTENGNWSYEAKSDSFFDSLWNQQD